MNQSQVRILITLRNGGRLTRVDRISQAALRRADGSLVCRVFSRTIVDLLEVHGYLQQTDSVIGCVAYGLTNDGWRVAKSIRNQVTP